MSWELYWVITCELLGVDLETVSGNHVGTVPGDNLRNACRGSANCIWVFTWQLVGQELVIVPSDNLGTVPGDIL